MYTGKDWHVEEQVHCEDGRVCWQLLGTFSDESMAYAFAGRLYDNCSAVTTRRWRVIYESIMLTKKGDK